MVSKIQGSSFSFNFLNSTFQGSGFSRNFWNITIIWRFFRVILNFAQECYYLENKLGVVDFTKACGLVKFQSPQALALSFLGRLKNHKRLPSPSNVLGKTLTNFVYPDLKLHDQCFQTIRQGGVAVSLKSASCPQHAEGRSSTQKYLFYLIQRVSKWQIEITNEMVT